MLKYLTPDRFKKKASEEPESSTDQAPQTEPAATTPDPTSPTSEEHHHLHKSHGVPVLDETDQNFLEELLARDDTPPPPLPPRGETRDWSDDDTASVASAAPEEKGKGKEVATEPEAKKPNRLSAFFTRSKTQTADGLAPSKEDVPEKEAEREKRDLSRVLDRLNLSARNNTAISTTTSDASDLLTRFTQIFKDLVAGGPTAVDDLMRLIDDRDNLISRGFEKLPNSLQKLVTQLPEKLTASIAPELLLVAAESQGIKMAQGQSSKQGAKALLKPQNVVELVSKPGALVAMLRAIVETLKARWPAFIGMNVIWSVALSLLLFVLWYCHKRGREIRLEEEASQEASAGATVEEVEDEEKPPGAQELLPAPEQPAALPAPDAEETEMARALEQEAVAKESKKEV